MADSQRENINNQREYNDLLDVTKSMLSDVSKTMSQLQDTSDKRNKTLSNEVDMTKEILENVESEEDIVESINKFKTQSVNLSDKSLGINENLRDVYGIQLRALEGISSTYQAVNEEIEMINEGMDSFSNSISGTLDNIVSMVGEIPVIGGILNSFLEPMFNGLSSKITEVSSEFREGFSKAFGTARMNGQSFNESINVGLANGISKAKALIPILANPFVLAATAAAALFALSLAGFFQIEQSAEAFREQTGLLENDTRQISKNIQSVVADTARLGVGFEDVQNAAVSFTQEFDNIDQASSAVLKSMVVLNKNFGISLETSAKVNKIFSSMSGSSSETAQNMIQLVRNAADLVGVAPQKVLEDIAENSEVAFQFFGGSVSELASAAVEAERLGTSIGEMANLAENLIDFESSITKELEASALLGQRINLNRARGLAFEGELAQAQEETLRQLDKIGDLTQLNRFEQQAIVDLTGMELSSLLRQQQIRSRFGDLDETQLQLAKERLAAGEELGSITREQLDNEAEALEKRREITNMFTELGQYISGITLQTLAALAPFAKGVLVPIMNAIKNLGSAFSELTSLFSDAGVEGEHVAEILEFIANIISIPLTIGINAIAGAIGVLVDSVEFLKGLFGGVYTIIQGIFSLNYGQVGEGFREIGNAILDFFISIPMRLIDAIKSTFENTSLGGLFGISSADDTIDDGVIQNGKVVSTNPADTLIATKNPERFIENTQSSGNGNLIQEIKGLRDDLNKGKVAVYIDGKKATSAVSNVVDKIGSNSYAI